MILTRQIVGREAVEVLEGTDVEKTACIVEYDRVIETEMEEFQEEK